jgi:hypothetical protein
LYARLLDAGCTTATVEPGHRALVGCGHFGSSTSSTSILASISAFGNETVANERTATRDDERRREVRPVPTSPDEAIRFAAKLAIDGGDYDRARALLDSPPPRGTSVTALADVRRKP